MLGCYVLVRVSQQQPPDFLAAIRVKHIPSKLSVVGDSFIITLNTNFTSLPSWDKKGKPITRHLPEDGARHRSGIFDTKPSHVEATWHYRKTVMQKKYGGPPLQTLHTRSPAHTTHQTIKYSEQNSSPHYHFTPLYTCCQYVNWRLTNYIKSIFKYILEFHKI